MTKRTVEALKPAAKSWIAWDDTLTGFGIRVQPTGLKSYIVNYRAGDGGRKAPNKRVVLGRHGGITAEQARHMAQQVLREAGDGPVGGRAEAGGMPLLKQAFDDYMAVNPKRTVRTNKHYRNIFGYLADWRMRPLDAIGRRDVEDRFNSLTRNNGWAPANMSISLLGSIYRRPCVDLEGLRNPVELWRAGGGIRFSIIPRSGARSPPRRRCCRAGKKASRRGPSRRLPGTRSGSGCIPACA